MSLGLPYPFGGESSKEAQAPVAASNTADIPLPEPREVAAPAPPARAARPVARRDAPSAPSAPRETAPPAVRESSEPVMPLPVTSLRVVHQHRLGSCRGQLVVSRDGVAYIPDDVSGGKDGFQLKYTQFLDELGGDSLRITSHERDYRFRAAASAGDREQLERIATAIARFR